MAYLNRDFKEACFLAMADTDLFINGDSFFVNVFVNYCKKGESGTFDLYMASRDSNNNLTMKSLNMDWIVSKSTVTDRYNLYTLEEITKQELDILKA